MNIAMDIGISAVGNRLKSRGLKAYIPTYILMLARSPVKDPKLSAVASHLDAGVKTPKLTCGNG